MKKSSKGKPAKQAYHHGDLRAALLAAAEVVIRRDGVAGLGLRAVTREAGVSHTAAKPHFGDLSALRGELAAIGFRRLAAALAAPGDVTPLRARRVAIARAYVRFASDHSALFNLMFRNEMLDMRQPALVEATALAVRALAGPLVNEANPEGLSREGAIQIAGGWALVHGLAVLLVEKRLRGIAKRAPGFSELQDLIDAVLESATLEFEF